MSKSKPSTKPASPAFDDLFVPPTVLDDDSYQGNRPALQDNPIYPSVKGKYLPKTDYTRDEVSFRKEFITEYVKDNNAEQALMRLGRTASNAATVAPRIMSEQLVLNLIAEYTDTIASQADRAEDNLREDVVMVLRNILGDPEAKASERVAAARLLTDIHGFNKQSTNTVNSGVMLVPFISDDDADNWSEKAQSMQAQLRVDVLRAI